MVTILGSVGRNGVNNPQDVRTVQTFLNKHRTVPLQQIAVNNACSPETILAIEDFQRRVVKFQSPDGRVDPGGKTWKALIGSATGANPPNNPRTTAELTFISETGFFSFRVPMLLG